MGFPMERSGRSSDGGPPADPGRNGIHAGAGVDVAGQLAAPGGGPAQANGEGAAPARRPRKTARHGRQPLPVYVVAAPTGTGKSTAVARAVADKGRTCVLTDRRDDVDAMAD